MTKIKSFYSVRDDALKFDFHEQCYTQDKEAIQLVLGIEADWKSIPHQAVCVTSTKFNRGGLPRIYAYGVR